MDNANDNSMKMINFIKKAMTVVFCGLLIAIAFILIYYANVEQRIYPKENNITYIGSWIVTTDEGEKIRVGRSYTADRKYNGEYKISATLPDNITDDSVLCFKVGVTDFRVYINGKLRYDFVSERDVLLPGGNVFGYYQTVDLNAADSNASVTIVKSAASNKPQIVTETFVSDMSGVYDYLLSSYGISFIMSVFLVVISGLVLLFSIAMALWVKQKVDLIYAALGIFIVGGWLITNSYLFPFVTGYYHVNGPVNYMLCLMMPFGLLKYLDSLQNGRYQKMTSIMLLVGGVNAIVWTVLHFTGVFAFSKALIYIDLILGIIIAIEFIALFYDFKFGNIRKYKFSLIGLIGFLVFGIIEIIYLMFFDLKNDSIPMLLGLIWLLIFVTIQQIGDFRRAVMEKQNAIVLSETKTRFLANMSHEIRTPINSIIGMNEMILRESRDDAISEYAAIIQNSGKMLLSLVNDVLDFSKIECGKFEITNAKYKFSNLLIDIISIIEERATQKNLKFDVTIEVAVPQGQISDEFRIKQILINLLTNAVKYTSKGSVSLIIGGKYRVCEGEDDIFDLEFTVRDTGKGIKEEDIEGLFDAFVRADIKGNRNIEGTGLGLAIVKSIVESMNGNISVKSRYGYGSSFVAWIPVKVFDKSSAKLEFNSSKGREHDISVGEYGTFSAPGANILAVDDNASNLKIVKLFLKAVGISPDTCYNGNEAVAMCRQKRYDVILMDHMMPYPDGVETLKIIRADKKNLNTDTPTIVLTANALAGSKKEYLEAGFVDYISKPIEAKLFEEIIVKYIPKDKIESASERGAKVMIEEDDVMEFMPVENEPDSSKMQNDYDDMLNEEDGLLYCADNVEFYKEMLTDYIDMAGERKEELSRAYESMDLSAYGINAHSLKSISKTIGAKDVSEMALKLEQAAKEGKEDVLRANHNELLRIYDSTLKVIKRAL